MLGLDLAQVIVPLLAFKFLFTINCFSELLSSACFKGPLYMFVQTVSISLYIHL